MNNALRSIIISDFINSMPGPLRELVMKEPRLHEKSLVKVVTTIELAEHILTKEVYLDILRNVVDGVTSGKIVSIAGNEVGITYHLNAAGDADLELDGRHCLIRAVGLMSKNHTIRLVTLDGLVEACFLSNSFLDKWKPLVDADALTSDQLEHVQADLQTSLNPTLDSAIEELSRSGAISFQSFMPKCDEPFLALLGSSSPSQSFINYFCGPLCARRAIILNKDVSDALAFIGPTSLFVDQLTIESIAAQSGDELPEILSAFIDSHADPLSLALVFDLCASSLAQYPELIDVGLEVINKTFGPESENMIHDFCLSLSTTLGYLSESGSSFESSIYYKRLSAWTWAGFIARALSRYDFDRKHMQASYNSTGRHMSIFAGILDRYDAPFWRSEWTDVDQVRGFLHKRFDNSVSNIPEASMPEPWKQRMNEILESYPRSHSFYHCFPGPIDEFIGDCQPLLSEIPELEASLLKNHSDPAGALSNICLYSYLAGLTDDAMKSIREMASLIKGQFANGYDIKIGTNAVHAICHIAVIKKDESLARQAIEAMRVLNEKSEGECSIAELLCIFDASCAFSDKNDRFKFISEKSALLAFGTIGKASAKGCLQMLRTVCKTHNELLTPLSKAMSALGLASRSSSLP